MKRDQFIRQLRREAKEAGRGFEVDRRGGKGSHYLVRVGNRETTLKSGSRSGELTNAYMRLIRRQLDLP